MTENTDKSIPNNIFFVWFGPELPWTARLAILSAIKNAKPEKVQLIQSGLSDQKAELEKFFNYPGFEILEAGPHWFAGDEMDAGKNLYEELNPPAARSNLLRLAVLYKQGGIYLDTDTITLKPFASLLNYRGFCGLEPLALPASLYQSLNPIKWLKAGVLLTLRDICTRLPRGYQLFHKIEKYYTQSTNNAVMGYLPGNPFIAEAFNRMDEIDEADKGKRFRLGTHLLQTLSANKSSSNLQVLPSEYFYPLGPELSSHLFKKNSAAHLDEFLKPETITVHWYQSIYSRLYPNGITLGQLKKNNTAFAKLAEPYWDKLARDGVE